MLTSLHSQPPSWFTRRSMDSSPSPPALPIELITLILCEAILGHLAEGHQRRAALLCLVAAYPLLTLRQTLYYQPTIRANGYCDKLRPALYTNTDLCPYVRGLRINFPEEYNIMDTVAATERLIAICPSLVRLILDGDVNDIFYLSLSPSVDTLNRTRDNMIEPTESRLKHFAIRGMGRYVHRVKEALCTTSSLQSIVVENVKDWEHFSNDTAKDKLHPSFALIS